MPGETGDDDGRVEEALVVRREDERALIAGDFLETLDLEVEEIAKHDLAEAERNEDESARGWDESCVDGVALDLAGVFVDDFVPSGGGALVLGAAMCEDGINEVAHGVDLGGDGVRDVGAYLLVERDEQFDALHGVEAEIEFEVVAGLRRIFLQLGGGLNDAERLG